MLNIFLSRCNVNFETIISALNKTKRTENITLDDIGNILLVPRNKQFSTRTQRWDSVLEFSTDAMITPTMLLWNLFEFQYIQLFIPSCDKRLQFWHINITPME